MARTKQTARKSIISPQKPAVEEPAAPMTAEQQALIEAENEARNKFAENPNSYDLRDPHLLLFDVFDGSHDWSFTEQTSEEKAVPKILTQWQDTSLSGSTIVPNFQTFESNWESFTNGMFKGLDWNNVFVAGGAVLANLINPDHTGTLGYQSSDIDIFLYGIDDQYRANQKLKEIYEVVRRNTGVQEENIIKTLRTVTIINSYPNRHIQIILRLYKSPAEVLLGFDIDCCTFGFDGKNVWAMERGYRALTKRYNLVNPTRRSSTYESRLLKYAKRGFIVAVPNLDKARVDKDNLFQKNAWEASGLGKLLIYDHQSSNPFAFGGFRRRGRKAKEDEEASDYNPEVSIPWGPGWFVNKIMAKLKAQQRAHYFANLFRAKKYGLSTSDVQENDSTRLFIGDVSAVLDKVDWVTQSPAYQDIDQDFRRKKLLTGSFTPSLSLPWEDGVYIGAPSTSLSAVSSFSSPVKSSEASTSYRFPVSPKPVSAAPSTPPSQFISRNQQFKQARETGNLNLLTPPQSPAAPKTSSFTIASAASPSRVTTEDFFVPLSSSAVDASPTYSTAAASYALDVSAFQPKPASAITSFVGDSSSSSSNIDLSAFGPTVSSAPSFYSIPTASSAALTTPSSPSAFGVTSASTSSSTTTGLGFNYAQPAPYNSSSFSSSSASANLFGQAAAALAAGHRTGEDLKGPTKILLLLSRAYKEGCINEVERRNLKDLFIRENEVLTAAAEVYEIDGDWDELVDTFQRIAQL
ncbi:Ankyrin [Balamuthia mandrillaris]